MFGTASEEELKKALKTQAAEQSFADVLSEDYDFEALHKGLFEHLNNQIVKMAFL